MKKVALVGSTGSIGRQVIDVIEGHGDKFKAVCLIANCSAAAFEAQLASLSPEFAALTDIDAAKSVKNVPDGTRFFAGEDGALKALEECGADVAFVACGGFAGLKYSLKVASLGMVLALANKESLVCGGEILLPAAQNIVPVDSEHSAIWQCLNFDRRGKFSRLVITASGGAFRGKKWEELKGVTAAQATAHPTWKMGAKITVDSATLLNKGYEIIEAHHLYGAPYDKITAVIHPQSIVHSLVGFEDGAYLAQLSCPDMRLPIQLALTYPQRMGAGLEYLDFTKAFSLDFSPLERGVRPLFDLAVECGRAGGIMPAVLNAASEIADGAFLRGEIGFTDIFTVCDKTVQTSAGGAAESYDGLAEADKLARLRARKFILG